MGSNDRLERLAATARRDLPPSLHVADRVAATLTARQLTVPSDFGRSMGFCAAAATFVALLVAVPAFDAWLVLSDPLNTVFSQLALVLP